MGWGKKILIISLLFGCVVARAELETTATLPKGVYSPKFTFGNYTGIDEKYNSSGLMEGVADQYRFNLTGKNLSRLDPKFKTLVDGLNSLPTKQRLGDEFPGGTLI